jgi:hypothetical protein
MKDPSWLLSQTGTLEAQLLEAVRDVDPPLAARDEVWRRVGLAAGAATLAAAATPLAARGAAWATSRALAQSSWLSAVKWVAVVGSLAPAAGVAMHWVVVSRTTAATAPKASALRPAAPSQEVALESIAVALPDPTSIPLGVGVAPRRGPAASNLDAESALLRRAREELEQGDAKAALDDIALLATRFPRGELLQEREVVAINALLAQRQRSAAATRTADFLRLHPNSPYADSLRQALKP